MNQDEILGTLRQVIAANQQFTTWTISTPHIMELIRICVEQEREACARLCYELGAKDESFYAEFSRSEDCAEAIRARGEK